MGLGKVLPRGAACLPILCSPVALVKVLEVPQ